MEALYQFEAPIRVKYFEIYGEKEVTFMVHLNNKCDFRSLFNVFMAQGLFGVQSSGGIQYKKCLNQFFCIGWRIDQ